MSTHLNRKQRRAVQAQVRRDRAITGSKKVDSKTRVRALRAFEIIKKSSSMMLAAQPNLYSKCAEGIELYDELRRRSVPGSKEKFHYGSLLGQQTASLFAEVTLDNVLTVLIEERHDRKWSWNIVVDNGLIFGSRGTEPCASREEAEEGALVGLAMIGRSAEPAPDYVPEAEPDKKLQIRVNGTGYVVPKMSDDPRFAQVLREVMRIEGTTYDGLLARFANLVLLDGVENHPVALMILANCDWVDLTQEILENFCAANGIEM